MLTQRPLHYYMHYYIQVEMKGSVAHLVVVFQVVLEVVELDSFKLGAIVYTYVCREKSD